MNGEARPLLRAGLALLTAATVACVDSGALAGLVEARHACTTLRDGLHEGLEEGERPSAARGAALFEVAARQARAAYAKNPAWEPIDRAIALMLSGWQSQDRDTYRDGVAKFNAACDDLPRGVADV